MAADSETRSNARAIYRILTRTYPEVRCELDFTNPLELTVAVVLSAQCTDKRINSLTPALFKKYKKAKDYARAPLAEIEEYIFSAGFYHAKARHLKGLGTKLVEDFDGKVPATIEELVTLPGVGRKTANVILGNAFDLPGITVDTHFGRLSRRFGWTNETDPVKVEFAMHEIFPPKYWTHLSQLVVWHGRRRCHARKPACGACPIADLCPSFGEGPTDKEIALKLVKKDSDFR